MNKWKIIALIALMGIIFGRSILEHMLLPPIAYLYNNYELSNMENIILREFEFRDSQIYHIESKIYGESYLMLSHNTAPWLESCIYSTSLELNEEFNLDSSKISTLISDFNNEPNNQFKISFHKRSEYRENDSLTISTKTSIPLGNKYRTISMNTDNTSTLAPQHWIYPLPFYDPRCRTMKMHNGA